MVEPGTYLAQLNLSLGGRLLTAGREYPLAEGDPVLADPETENALAAKFLVAKGPDGYGDVGLQPQAVRCCGG